MNEQKEIKHINWGRFRAGAVMFLLCTGLVAGWGYTFMLLRDVQELHAEDTDKIAQAEVRISDLEDMVSKRDADLDAHKQLLAVANAELGRVGTSASALEQAVMNVTAVAGDLVKLRDTDEELLAKYSKVYFLNEHYVPPSLSYMPSAMSYDEKQLQVHSSVQPFLVSMFNAMKAQGLSPEILSAYRSFGEQANLKGTYVQTYGTGANTFSADQGYSEHQLGTTIDFTNAARGAAFDGFDDTAEYKWLVAHAHEFGFTMSYPEGNSYYEYEPWHWRFVGVALATALHNQDIHFYDMPQREIDQYRTKIFD